jgi:hypothetical protein
MEPGEKARMQAIYATLSHCWGKADFIQTTKETLDQRKQGIKWADLPRTFQDAIEIVRALNIQFLWIDSLCIVQNDDLDWKRESACMAGIYSNSFLNIAATGSFDSSGGCLSQRRLMRISRNLDIQSFPVNAHSDTANSTVFVRPSFDPVHHRYSTNSNRESDPPDTQVTPLLSRAWVFQERQLALRTIHFHPSEMVMECKSNFSCECTGLDKAVPKSRRSSLDMKLLHTNEVYNCWFEVVQEYSKLRLTRKSDRLVALAGVATVFQLHLGSGYLTGLWKGDIIRGLLWDVTKNQRIWPHRKFRRLQHQFAPSWSWASLIMGTL